MKNIFILIFGLVILGLSSCSTVKYQLGGESNGETEEAVRSGFIRFGGVLLGGTPVDIATNCDGNVANLTISRSFGGDKIVMECGSGKGVKKMKKKKKKRRKKRRKKKRS